MSKKLKSKRTQQYLYHLAGFLHQHAFLVLGLFLVSTVLFGRWAIRLEQKTTLRDLLPADNEVVRNFEETVDDFDLIDRIVIVLKFDPKDLEVAETFSEILVEQATGDARFSEYLQWLKANLFAQASDAQWHQYLQYLFRLIPADQIPSLAQRLSSDGIAQQIAENRRELESGLASTAMIENDPLNLVEFAGSYSKDIMGNYQISFTDGFLLSKSKDMLLILGKPLKSPEDVNFSMALDEFLKEKIEQTKLQMNEEEGVEVNSLLQIGLTGPHPIAAHENRMIKKDMISMFFSSFVTVILLFIMAYHRPLALIYVGIPLLSAEIWTLGIGYLLFGRLNLLTAAFSAVIIGLGIDYAIHLFSRYLDERAANHQPLQAMRLALGETGLGTFAGALTTALAFLSIGFTSFTGLQEFAVLASIGIMLCMLHIFIMMPVLIFIRERFRKTKAKPPKVQWDFRLTGFLNFVFRHKRLILFGFLCFTVAMLVLGVQLRFNTDIRSIRAKSNPSLKLQDEVTAKVGGSLRSLSFVLEASDEASLYAMHKQLEPTLATLKAEGLLVRYDSLLLVLPQPERQIQNLLQLTEAGLSGEMMKDAFLASMEAQGLNVSESTADYIRYLALGLDTQQPMTLENLVSTNRQFVRPFLNKKDGKFKTLVYVYPSVGLWEKHATREVTERILSSAKPLPGSRLFVTGVQTISDELKLMVQESFKVTTFFSLLLVFVCLVFHFRNGTLIALVLSPLIAGMIWMLGVMKLLGIDITVLNFIAAPIIVGIGIDDGIHILEKYLHRTSDNIQDVILSSAKAVTLTSLTTVLGFSSLFLAEYSGFRSLGLCSILGVSFCWLASIVLLPLLVDFFNISHSRNTAIEKEPASGID